MPRASNSGDSRHTSRNGVPDTAFRQRKDVGITIKPISELIPHGLLTHCVRFAPASHAANGMPGSPTALPFAPKRVRQTLA